MSKMNISPEEKIAAVKSFLNGEGSQRSIAVHLGISFNHSNNGYEITKVWEWMHLQ